MTQTARRIALVLPVALGLSLACSENRPVGMRIAVDLALPSSPLTLAQQATLVRVPDGFVLAAADGPQVHWARLSPSGALSNVSSFTLPVAPSASPTGDTLGPYLAVTSKSAPADQLLAVVAVLKPGTADHYEIRSFAHTAGSSAAPVETGLGTVVAAKTSGAIRILAGSSASGTRAIVAWGVEGQPAPVSYVVLGGDGAPVGAVAKVYENATLWSCLRVVDSPAGFAITALEPTPGDDPLPTWHLFAIDEAGELGSEPLMVVPTPVNACRIVSTAVPSGYLLAWQSQDGTFYALYHAATDGKVTSRIVRGSAEFGGYPMMPQVAWIAPAGRTDFSIGLARAHGPEVALYDAFSNPRGRSLRLRSASDTAGPVSAWVGGDSTWVTYLDPAPALGGNPVRYLVSLEPAPQFKQATELDAASNTGDAKK